MDHNAVIQSQSIADEPDLTVMDTPTVVAGATAAINATKRAIEAMGVIRSAQTLLNINQKDGFDCQSCAWPVPDKPHIAEFCENGVKALADEAMRKTIGAEFFSRWSISALSQQTDHWLNKQGRLAQPMYKPSNSDYYEPIGWETAFAIIARELNRLDDPNEAIFYTSGRTSNEAAFMYQLFIRQFGTNNMPDCSNMCHESSGAALSETVGVGKGTVTLDDFDHADAILIIGQNPGTNHPRMLMTLQKAIRNGATIISLNPLPEAGLQAFSNPQEVMQMLGQHTKLASIHVPVRINGDAAALKGIMKLLLDAEQRNPNTVLDHAFINEYTTGFAEFKQALDQVTWDEIEHGSGVTRRELQAVADVLLKSKNVIVCWAMGLTQHKEAVATIQEIVNLQLMRGNIGRKGAGLCPVRGHSNVQGDRTMGIWHEAKPAFMQALAREFNFTPPTKTGYSTVEAIEAMHVGKAHVFVAMGGNVLSAAPDTEYTAEAMRRTRLSVYVSTKLNRAHLITGDQALILPCIGRSERDLQASGLQKVSVEDSMGVISPSQGVIAPASELLRSEPAIVAGIAAATLGERSTVDWHGLASDYRRIRNHIEHTITGFANYNQRLDQGGFVLPNTARERNFAPTGGKAKFTIHPIPQVNLQAGELLMMTIRSHDQFNTTVYDLNDRYRGIYNGRRVIFMNADDMAEQHLADGDMVDIISHYGHERIAENFRVVPFAIPRRCSATYFPEANVVVPIDVVADKSKTPISKSVVVRVRKC